MILGRNIFVLLLLMAYVQGREQWNFNYPHEVYVVAKSHPNEEPLIGCIKKLGEKTELVVPACSKPHERKLTILYRDPDGTVCEASVRTYQKTNSPDLLLLTLHVQIVHSSYAKEAEYFRAVPGFINGDHGPINVKFTDAKGEESTFSMTQHSPDLTYYNDIADKKSSVILNANTENIRLLKGASLVTEFATDSKDVKKVIGMFEKSTDEKTYFNVYDWFRILGVESRLPAKY